MSATETNKLSKSADSVEFPIPLIDRSGAGTGPFVVEHASTDSQGALIDPATHQDVQSVISKLGTAPAQDASVQALGGTLTDIDSKVATAAAQATGNTSLASIDAKTPAKGSAQVAGSTPMALASDHGPLPAVTGQATAAKQDAAQTTLSAIQAGIATLLQAGGAVTVSNLPGTQQVAFATAPTVNVGTTGGIALDATVTAGNALLSSLLTTIQAQRSETLWTDDTNAYFVRIEKAGVLSWTDQNGNATSAPGTGARPADGTAVSFQTTNFQATAAATGYSIGDYINHVDIVNPSSGSTISSYWYNVSQSAKLASAPAGGNLQPVSPLAAGAATLSAQISGNTILSNILTALGTPLQAGGSVTIANFPATQAISAAALPLPTGAATAAAQATGNASLSSIDSKTPPVGAAAAAASRPVALATDQLSTLAKDGTDVTGVVMPTGGAGIRGWLSGIYNALIGTLKTSEVAPTPVVSAAGATSVVGKGSAGKFLSLQATNTSTTDYGFAVVCDLTTAPAVGAVISPKKWAKLPLSDGTPAGPGTTDLDEPVNCLNGVVVLLTTTLATYTPATMAGLISVSPL